MQSLGQHCLDCFTLLQARHESEAIWAVEQTKVYALAWYVSGQVYEENLPKFS